MIYKYYVLVPLQQNSICKMLTTAWIWYGIIIIRYNCHIKNRSGAQNCGRLHGCTWWRNSCANFFTTHFSLVKFDKRLKLCRDSKRNCRTMMSLTFFQEGRCMLAWVNFSLFNSVIGVSDRKWLHGIQVYVACAMQKFLYANKLDSFNRV